MSRANGAGGAGADDSSFNPAVSADGRVVVFQSMGDNLSAEDTNECALYIETGEPYFLPCVDTYLRDLGSGTTAFLAPAFDTQGSVYCGPAISPDGRFVAVESEGLVRLFDRQAGSGTVASRADGLSGALATGTCPAVSADGRRVAFEGASSLDANGCCGHWSWPEVYVRDLAAGSTTLASRNHFYAGTLGQACPGCAGRGSAARARAGLAGDHAGALR